MGAGRQGREEQKVVERKRKCEVDIKRDDAGETHVGGIRMCEKRQIVRIEEVFIEDGRVLKSRKTRLRLGKSWI